MKKTTQKEIAEKLGLHVRTISRVLNHADSVKLETRQRVIEELNNHGYFFQNHTHSETVAVDIQSGYLEKNALQLMEMLSHHDLHFLMTNHKKDLQHFYRTVSTADVVIFCSTPSAQIIEEAARRNPGIYRINLFSHGVPGAEVSIEPDNDVLAKRSAKYLAQKGHKNIWVISSADSISVQERTKSFVGELTVSYPDCRFRIISGELNMTLGELLLAEFSDKSKAPTAVYAPGLYLAWHTAQVLKKLQYRIPEDISILINDLPEEFLYELPFRPDTVYSRISDTVELAQFHILNRFMLKSAASIVSSPGTHLEINGTVKDLTK
jgi:DNA-binding LacI/PurR family transcriptional regulator